MNVTYLRKVDQNERLVRIVLEVQECSLNYIQRKSEMPSKFEGDWIFTIGWQRTITNNWCSGYPRDQVCNQSLKDDSWVLQQCAQKEIQFIAHCWIYTVVVIVSGDHFCSHLHCKLDVALMIRLLTQKILCGDLMAKILEAARALLQQLRVAL